MKTEPSEARRKLSGSLQLPQRGLGPRGSRGPRRPGRAAGGRPGRGAGRFAAEGGGGALQAVCCELLFASEYVCYLPLLVLKGICELPFA